MTDTKETKKSRRVSTYEIVMQKIRQHCEELEARGITL